MPFHRRRCWRWWAPDRTRRKLLWHQYSPKELIPAVDAAQQAIFNQGHEVGQRADGTDGGWCDYWLLALGRTGVALVVLVRGVNVGGHRTFRPTALAAELKHLDAANIGAAGTFVIRRPVTQARVRAELARRLPFDAEVMICEGREVVRLLSRHPFANQPLRPDIVRFVSVLARCPRSGPSLPVSLPSSAGWLLKILARDGRFVFGIYRRQMKVIGHLGTIDRLFGTPATTRNWNTITAIAKVLDAARR